MSNRWIGRSARDDTNLPAKPGLQSIARRSARSTSRTRFRPRDEDLGSLPDFVRHPGLGRNELRGEPREQTDQIVRDQDLAVAMRTRADPDRGNLESAGDLPRRLRAHDLQDDGKHAGPLHRLGIPQERFGFGLRPALYLIAAFLADT